MSNTTEIQLPVCCNPAKKLKQKKTVPRVSSWQLRCVAPFLDSEKLVPVATVEFGKPVHGNARRTSSKLEQSRSHFIVEGVDRLKETQQENINTCQTSKTNIYLATSSNSADEHKIMLIIRVRMVPASASESTSIDRLADRAATYPSAQFYLLIRGPIMHVYSTGNSTDASRVRTHLI